jgi:glycine/D-amino acid oxidase-like deaminating enzyme
MRQNEQKQEHTNSWYAATVNEVTDYPKLEGAESTDICVVGGGFSGVSTALTLAERGYSVALVEANRIGWGASGRNGGQLIHGGCGLDKLLKKYGDSIADMVWDMQWRGNDIIRRLLPNPGRSNGCTNMRRTAEHTMRQRRMKSGIAKKPARISGPTHFTERLSVTGTDTCTR